MIPTLDFIIYNHSQVTNSPPTIEPKMHNSPNATLKTTNHSHEPDEDAEFLEKLENNKRHLPFFDTKFTKFIKSLSAQERGRFFDLYEEAGEHLTLQGLEGADLDRAKWLILGEFSAESRNVFEQSHFAITKDTTEWDLLQEVHFAWIAWGKWLKIKPFREMGS
ncbi:hypothetical protein HYALB_00010469 [Hymenoscyphus albidus]|uniref:Uncharacterized protein n=1 Tax=Hymenoscyphus albidus TaxID=595503 RepID=A0A9N9LJU4_9HELO|nr:hypothetical protein HYALB_00010469 [Hymenoscyphus albidus]